MSAPAALQLDPSTIVSTNPGRNYEVVGEVRVSSAADIAVAVRQARVGPAHVAGARCGRPLQGFGAIGVLIRGARQEIAEIIAREMATTQADGATCWMLDHMRWRTTARKTCPEADGSRRPTTLGAARPEIGVG